ncbi:MAG: protein-L-isoaspartate(D-aspartate) O-methyltransferase [Candidatus Omnitrophota bacterium]
MNLLLPIFALSSGFAWAADEDAYLQQRRAMVHQLRLYGITDPGVLDVMMKVKRHLFVDPPVQEYAYEDAPLPIGRDQTISQPYIVAYMTEAARLKKDDRVLEIGTGSGYQAAILAEIVKEVYTIEIIKELAEDAEKRLQSLGYRNVTVKHGDGYEGWPEKAPFDAIIVTAAPDQAPKKLLEQLAIGGRMVAPIGSFFQDLYLYTRTEKGIEKKKLLPVRFVPMVNQER